MFHSRSTKGQTTIASTARRRLTFALLLLASIGAAQPVNFASIPLTFALAENGPVPVVNTAFGWTALIDLIIRIAALVLAWFTHSKPPSPTAPNGHLARKNVDEGAD